MVAAMSSLGRVRVVRVVLALCLVLALIYSITTYEPNRQPQGAGDNERSAAAAAIQQGLLEGVAVQRVELAPTPSLSAPHSPVTQCLCRPAGEPLPDECPFARNRSVLINSPQRDATREQPPCLLQDAWPRRYEEPVHSVILIVHNHEDVVEVVLERVVRLARELFEVIVVVDGCTDHSEDKVVALMKELVEGCMRPEKEPLAPAPIYCVNPEMVHARVIRQATGMFESSASNLALRASRGKYATLVQDDQFMEMPGYNAALVAPLRLYDDVFAVSGRCAHSRYSVNVEEETVLTGRCGGAIDRPLHMGPVDRCTLFIRDTVNRGPLTVRMDRLQQLGYFDEQNFVLGDDDHDLMARAYYQHNWLVGLLPLDFVAPLSMGSTRRGRSEQASQYLNWRRQRSNGGFLGTIPKVLSSPERKPVHDEQRPLPISCFQDGWWRTVSHDLDARMTTILPPS